MYRHPFRCNPWVACWIVTTTTLTTDAVAIQTAQYDTSKRQLRVEATSTSSTATLTRGDESHDREVTRTDTP